MTRVPRVLTVAGSDSSGGAGIQRDLAVFAAMGVGGVCAVTAVTAQDATAVHAIHPVPPAIVAGQIRAAGRGVDAAKTGMLLDAEHVAAVAGALGEAGIGVLVVDPVIRSSSGTVLLDDGGVAALVQQLLPMAAVVTPNVAEAELLSGVRIRTVDQAAEAAGAIAALGPGAVVVTGGHLASDPVDVLVEGSRVVLLAGTRLPGTVRGTGCAFSAAVAAGMALGGGVEESVRGAKELVRGLLSPAAEPSRP